MRHALLFLLALALSTPATAQITITAADVNAFLGQTLDRNRYNTDDVSGLESVVNATGPNQTWDLTGRDFTLDEEASDRFTIVSLPDPDVPGAGEPEFDGATQAFVFIDPDVEASFFFSVEPSGLFEYGFFFDDGSDIIKVVYVEDEDDEPLQTLALPLTNGTTWSDVATERTRDNDGNLLNAAGITIEGEVDGYGTLITPAGSAPALRFLEVRERSAFFGGVLVTTSINFITKGGILEASITLDNQGNPESVSYSVQAGQQGEVEIAADEDGEIFNDFGVRINFTTGSSTPGTLNAFRFNGAPADNTFSGSAQSSDGTNVTPNVVWPGRFYVIETVDLQDFDAEVCIDVSAAPGDLSKTVIVSRAGRGEDWQPFDSELEGDLLCANVGSSFSQFAVASDDDLNPLPVELADFRVRLEGSDAFLTWTTASETNNAGFDVEHRAGAQGAWTSAGFVSGAGTSTAAVDYRFRVRDLAPGMHAFRLRQVDLDGTAHYSDAVEVFVRPSSAIALSTIAPNPVRDRATLRLVLQETQDVTVGVYDLLGRRVRELHAGTLRGGAEHQLTFDTAGLSSGLYFVRVTGAGHQLTRQISVIK